MIDLESVDFSKGGGTVTVVAQDDRTGRVLMVAAADREALERTISTGEMHYLSRSRGPWHKGATSGNVDQAVLVGLRLVRDVLHEQQREDVVLVLRGVHAAAQLVAALPERAVEVRLPQRQLKPPRSSCHPRHGGVQGHSLVFSTLVRPWAQMTISDRIHNRGLPGPRSTAGRGMSLYLR